MSNYTVRKLKIGKYEQLDRLARAAGELYSRTVVSFWRTVRHKSIWMKASSMMRWHNSEELHAHSADAVVQNFYASLQSWRARRKSDPNAKPPRRRRWFYKVTWKSSAIRLKNGTLTLSNGKGNEALVVDWYWEKPKIIEMGWDGKQYELRVAYPVEVEAEANQGTITGVDLGEIHLAVTHDGTNTDIFNGRYLRSVRRYQNLLKAKLSSLFDKKQRGSKSRGRLIKSKQKQLTKLKNQIKDILHKTTSLIVSTLKSRGVQTLVIGDVRNIRQDLDYGKKTNQKLHQWVFGEVRHMLTYKAVRQGMKVELISEAYTSQTCPSCGKRHKPKNRNYRCRHCGFEFHRDGVGSINIRRKYLGDSTPVVGLMASPVGVRFRPHLQRSLRLRPEAARIPSL